MNPASEPSAISKLIEEKTSKLLEEARLNNGRVDAAALRELTRLLKLAEFERSARTPRRVSRLPIYAGAFLTLAVASFLVFHPISAAEVALDAEVSQLGFEVSGNHTAADRTLLTQAWPLTNLSIDQASSIRMPTADPTTLPVEVSGPGALATFITKESTTSPGRLLLNSIDVPGGTRVEFAVRAAQNEYELRLLPPSQQSITINAAVAGDVEISDSETASGNAVSFSVPQEVSASAKGMEMILTFKSKQPAIEFVRNLPVADLRLSAVEEYLKAEHNLSRENSTIYEGTLYQESLKGEQVPLRLGEDLHFYDSSGILQSAGSKSQSSSSPRGHDAGIESRFTGSVRDMTIGHGPAARTLKPSTLEWLASRQALTLFWGTSLYFIGLIATLLAWFRKDVL